MSNANRSRGAHVIAMLTGLIPENILAEITNWRPAEHKQSDADRQQQLDKASAKRLRKRQQFINRGYR